LSQRVEEAIRRAELGEKHTRNGTTTEPWLADLLSYLDRRRETSVDVLCELPELFAALRERHTDISLKSFHEGLRRLRTRNAIRLISFTGPPEQLSQPEFALLDGGDVLYYAAR
jgi:hypothetical protein